MWLLAELAVLLLGQLYPAYKSFKALHTKSSEDIKKWVTYWVIFSLWHQVILLTRARVALAVLIRLPASPRADL